MVRSGDPRFGNVDHRWGRFPWDRRGRQHKAVVVLQIDGKAGAGCGAMSMNLGEGITSNRCGLTDGVSPALLDNVRLTTEQLQFPISQLQIVLAQIDDGAASEIDENVKVRTWRRTVRNTRSRDVARAIRGDPKSQTLVDVRAELIMIHAASGVPMPVSARRG